MSRAIERISPHPLRLRAFTLSNILEDIRLFLTQSYNVQEDGSYRWERVLPLSSLLSGYRRQVDPVCACVRGHTMQRSLIPWIVPKPAEDGRRLKALRYSHNLRTNVGGDWQANAMGASTGDTGTSTGTSATTLTDSGKSWTTNAWAGHIVAVGAAYAVIASNTGTVLTFGRWVNPASIGGSDASTPSSTSVYTILPGQAPAIWVGLTNDGAAPAPGDTTLASEIAANGFTRALAAYAHSTVAGSSTQQPTSHTLTVNYTATGNQAAQKAGMFLGKTASIMAFETAISPSMSAGTTDTAALTWTVSST